MATRELDFPILLSDLLEAAVNDVEACERDPGFDIDMEAWVYYSVSDKLCTVCLAGALLVTRRPEIVAQVREGEAKCLKMPDDLVPLMSSLNSLRSGCLEGALSSYLDHLELLLDESKHDYLLSDSEKTLIQETRTKLNALLASDVRGRLVLPPEAYGDWTWLMCLGELSLAEEYSPEWADVGYRTKLNLRTVADGLRSIGL